MNNKPKTGHSASKIPTSGRDSGTHSRSSSVSNLTTASDIHSEIGDAASESAEDFKLDERVWLNGAKPGFVKFIGKTQFAPGIWAGVLLDEPLGKNDGSVAGVKYFTCEPLRGIFARPSKLTRTPGIISGIGDSAGNVTPKASNLPSSRASVSSNISSTSPSRCSRLRVGERITVSSLTGLKLGTLRFIGETDFAKGEWVGIELDEPSGKNDGSVAGKRYFNCQMKYGLFAPLHKISRAGGTPVSRPGSVRGTPLARSNSRDSLSSSISNSSRASRVKLGITSLTQKKVGGGFITPTSKALQEALKEKDQHIEQLLKERDLDRAEFAKITSHFEEV
jgi:CAP-Gly domain-containing linker protein 1